MPSDTVGLPPADFAARPLSVRILDAARIVRISRVAVAGEPLFGRSGTNRFDDPAPEEASRYGVFYGALDLVTAFGETVLHENETESLATPAGVLLSATSLAGRRVLAFRGKPLRLARLYGRCLKALGGSGGIAKVIPYDVPQRWSEAAFRHPQVVDGFLYMSRNVDDRLAVAVFDRASPRLALRKAVELRWHPDLARVLRAFRLTLVDDPAA